MTSPRFHPFVRLLLCLCGALVLVVAVTLVVGAALASAARVTGEPVDLLGFATRNPLLVTLVFYPPILIWIWFCRRAFDRQSFASLGLRSPGWARAFCNGALCGALAISFLFGLLWVTGNARINGPSPEAFEIGPLATLSVLVFFALAFFAVGLMEEVTFRGYALHNLSAWMGVRAAVAVQAITFALVHLGNVSGQDAAGAGAAGAGDGGATIVVARSLSQMLWDTRWAMLNIALIGWFFALCYLKTGSLWFPIGFHAAWNFFLGCVWSLPVSGLRVFRILDVSVSPNTLVTGGGFGAEGSVFLAAIIATMIVLARLSPNHPQPRQDLALLRNDATISTTEATTEATTPAFATQVNAAATTTNLTEGAQEAVEESAPSRFKTSMRPGQRFGGAPGLDPTGWPHMSTHAEPETLRASTQAVAASPNEIAADSSLRVDVSDARALEAARSDEMKPQPAFAAPLRDDATSGQAHSVAPIENGTQIATGDVAVPTNSSSSGKLARAPMPIQSPLASDAPLNSGTATTASKVDLSDEPRAGTFTDADLGAEKESDGANAEPARELAPKKPASEAAQDRPAIRKSSPRW